MAKLTDTGAHVAARYTVPVPVAALGPATMVGVRCRRCVLAIDLQSPPLADQQSHLRAAR